MPLAETEAQDLPSVARPTIRVEQWDDPPRQSSLLTGLIRAARPRQWAKNVLVLAAPGAAGVLGHTDVLGHAALAFAAFCLVSSGTYFLNDARDVELDRLHPTKRHRPIAAGVVSLPVAVVTGALLLAAGIAVSATLRWQFVLVIAAYVLMTTSYTLWLKHVAVVDIVVIACGFIVRAVGGGVAVGVPLSRWFLIVASFGSLFIVSGKRHGEHLDLGPERAVQRPSLGSYSLGYLRYVWMMSSAVTLMGYCLWAFAQARGNHVREVFYELSIIPFALFILRYALMLEGGQGSAPEELLLRDRALLIIGALWVVVFGCGVYIGR
jgi:decaprenyl-phosphate phosphoribosyltransferase